MQITRISALLLYRSTPQCRLRFKSIVVHTRDMWWMIASLVGRSATNSNKLNINPIKEFMLDNVHGCCCRKAPHSEKWSCSSWQHRMWHPLKLRLICPCFTFVCNLFEVPEEPMADPLNWNTWAQWWIGYKRPSFQCGSLFFPTSTCTHTTDVTNKHNPLKLNVQSPFLKQTPYFYGDFVPFHIFCNFWWAVLWPAQFCIIKIDPLGFWLNTW